MKGLWSQVKRVAHINNPSHLSSWHLYKEVLEMTAGEGGGGIVERVGGGG